MTTNILGANDFRVVALQMRDDAQGSREVWLEMDQVSKSEWLVGRNQ